DIIALLGLLFGVGAIIAGNIVEGGTTAHLVQVAAALIVFGGTAGATMLSYPLKDLINAVSSLRMVFYEKKHDPFAVIEDSVNILVQARRMGLITLQPQIMQIENPFLRKGLNLVVDGMPPKMIRDILDQEISTYETKMRRASKVFESAGGYAPTIGILGAVLGLIQVMSNVAEPSKIGSGISVAFVATIYGVGSANLILLPIAKRILRRMNDDIYIMDLIVEGVLGVESGINPFFLRSKLNSFIEDRDKIE
ncbi:MAG TPA: flagellar motor protein, partial [Dissulfurispiraceae bacterium]|nr:flagellar motor protein [Dissulfurispiraceae bacterium]